MSDDLVQRLRRAIPREDDDELVQEAADRIEALEADLARLTVVDPVRTSVIEWQGNEWRTVTRTQWRPV